MTAYARVLLGLLLASLPRNASAQVVEGFLDGAFNSSCSIFGWARDPANAAPIQVRIYRDGDASSGVLVTTILADVTRPDLPFPDKAHGFDHAFTDGEIAAAGLADGLAHAIAAYGVAHNGSPVILTGGGKTLRCTAVHGHVDLIDSAACRITGWARSRLSTAPIQVRIYAGGDSTSGVLVATIMADRSRPDLPFPDKNHGFDHIFTTAEIQAGGFADGQFHAIRAYGAVTGGDTGELAGTGQLRCLPPTATITVDLNAPVTVTSASGFLHGFNSASPPDAAISALQPRYWRYAAGPPGRLQSLVPGITLDFVLSDFWGYPLNGWGGRGAPWLNWPAFEQFVRDWAQFLKFSGLPLPIVEVWNEPDILEFWSGTNEQFRELYRRAYSVLRSELGPSALIAGPSFAIYHRGAVQDFLDYCRSNGLEVNALTWHQNGDSPDDIGSFAARVQDARASFLQHPDYASLRITRIDTNEIVGPVYTHQPAGTLAHYDAFEQSGADAAARACWPDSHGANECFNSTLDGVVTAAAYEPRAVWWAHKSYADGVSSRVQSTVQNGQTGAGAVALASRMVAGVPAPQVLVGYVDYQRTLTQAPGTLNAHLTLNHLDALPAFAATPTVTLHIERIPATGEQALAAPTFVQAVEVDVVAGSAQIVLPPIAVGEVLRIVAINGHFTDQQLVAGATPIRSAHIAELRVRIDAQRVRRALQPFAWGDSIVAGTPVKAQHLMDLRAALAQAYSAAGLSVPGWTDPAIVGDTTVIRALHLTELRSAVTALESQ